MAEAAAAAELAASKRKTQLSLRGHGSHLTRDQNTVEAEIKRFMIKPTTEVATELRRLEGKIRNRMDLMQELYSSLEALEENDDTAKVVSDKSMEMNVKCNTVVTSIAVLLKDFEEKIETGATATTRTAGGERNIMREQLGLKPATLQHDSRPIDLACWIKAYQGYFTASKMHTLDIPTQQAYLRRTLDSDLQTLLDIRIDETSGMDECVSQIGQIFMEKYPLMTRRWNIFSE